MKHSRAFVVVIFMAIGFPNRANAEFGDQLFQFLPTGPSSTQFGIKTGISGHTAIVGSSRTTYVFDLNSGRRLHRLTEAGGAVDVDGDRAVSKSRARNETFVFDVVACRPPTLLSLARRANWPS